MEVGSEPVDARRAILPAAGAALCVIVFWGVGLRYAGFRIPYGFGVQEIHPAELVFSVWYLFLGIPAIGLAARALDASRVPDRALSGLRKLAAQPWALPAAVALAALTTLAIRAWVLQFAPTADDESTYVFIARTLLEGRLVNPSPGDEAFFRNQFVVLSDAAWYGKYPIGHPLVLAAGEALGLRALVGPALTAAALALTVAIGRRLWTPGQALLAGGLLLLSPQFLFTGATELSQTTSGVCLLLAVWALLRLDEGGGLRAAAVAGAALGFGVLARPLPGLLFLTVAGLWVLIRYQDEPVVRQARRVAVGLAPVALFGLVLLAVQAAQTGDPTRTSYDVYHGGSYRGFFRLEWISASLAGALLRQNFWLFGWPISFLFLFFARRDGRSALLWTLILAEYAYRVILPKTVVASTGPVYVAEVVPLLALLSANGMAEAARRLARHSVPRARERVAALALASVLVAATAFLPVQLRDLHRSGSTWQTAHRLLDEAGAERALVFADAMVDVGSAVSWAYYPPNPSPDLDDPRIFVRIPTGEGATDRALDFWRRRFPDRSAWVFVWAEGKPLLRRLESPVASSHP